MDGSLTPAGVRALRDGGQPFTLLDVRRRAAVDADPHLVPGAVWRDPAEVEGWATGLPLDRRVVVY